MIRSLGRARRILLAVGLGLPLVACAAAPITLHTLGPPTAIVSTAPLGARPVVIAVSRVTIPDYLDSQDIMVRRGSVLVSSHLGRWASRLSLGVTELVTARLAENRPDALVTDQPQTTTPAYRIFINISRLDIDAGTGGEGAASLEADWLIVPGDPRLPARRDRASLAIGGAVGTDEAVVALTTAALNRLAALIDVARPD